MFRQILGDVSEFVRKVQKCLQELSISAESFELDHICYRVSSSEAYEFMKTQMQRIADLVVESDVNGRPIATYQLHSPIEVHPWTVSVVEIPAPKAGKNTKNGLEHVEFTVHGDLGEFLKANANLEFNTTGLTKPLNRVVELNLDDCAVKFNEMPLLRVIELESSLA